jgi:hypothetical protein
LVAGHNSRTFPPDIAVATADLIWIKERRNRWAFHLKDMWQPISSAPLDRDLELAVIDIDGPHALVFPCQRILGGWINAQTKQRLDVRPTHWREWRATD